MQRANLKLLTGLFFMLASLAQAAPVECQFQQWKGGDTPDIVISWIGIGFIADESEATIQVRVPDGYYKPQKAELVKSKNFTGFVYYTEEEASDGAKYKNRYSFRIYNTGRCEGRIDKEGYRLLFGEGQIK